IGDIDANVAKYNDGAQRVPIRVRLPENARADLDLIRSLKLPTSSGKPTTLGSVADVYFQAGPAQIKRFDRTRQLSVQADRVGNMPISLPSAIGLLMLLGLAAKNSILLVEYAIERERAGATQRQALIEACRERARPIIMTTLAMQAGMLPTALGLGAGSEFR